MSYFLNVAILCDKPTLNCEMEEKDGFDFF